MNDIGKMLEELKAEPYMEMSVRTPHCGVLNFSDLREGDAVKGPSGQWREVPGTRVALLTREHNPQPVAALDRGVVRKLHRELDGAFVEAGVEIAVLRHYLTKKEVVGQLLRRSLHLFHAPERAKYYFAPEADKKIKIFGPRSVSVQDGMELFIASRMKREIPLRYQGPAGLIYEVYFRDNENVDAGAPLIGVCAPGQTQEIESVINRVRLEWPERD